MARPRKLSKGPPRVPAAQRRRVVHFSLAPAAIRELHRLARGGVHSRGYTLDRIILKHAELSALAKSLQHGAVGLLNTMHRRHAQAKRRKR